MSLPEVRYDHVNLKGGVDQITPTLSLTPGVCREAINFECLEYGGYGRIGGYERYSGQPAPSAAIWDSIYFAAFTNTPSVGQTITNGTATGYVINVGVDYVIYTKAVGSFAIGDTVLVGATVIGTSTVSTSSLTSKLNAQFLNLAASAYRSDINKPAGTGPIRGGFLYNDLIYCIRDNAGATAANLWKQSVSGWTQVTLFNEVSFTAGTTEPADGSTLTQGGVTAVIKRVVKQSGVWTGTAAGRFIVANPAGGNFAAGAATIGASTVTLSGIQTAITLLPGGKCEITKANFSGQLSSSKVYWADSVNRMMEFDGTTLVPIVSAAVPDTPKHIAAFKNHLFYSVQSSIFNSGIGDPYSHTALSGAVEQPCGDTVTNLIIQPGSQTSGAMTVHCRNTTFALYGTSSADWNMVVYNNGTGALDYTGQNMAQSYTMDDRGVISLSTTLNFGNFDAATLTNKIRPFISGHRTLVSCSSLDRSKSQYRLFFTDGTGLYITIVNGESIGCMQTYYPIYFNVAWEGTLTTGELVKFIGGSDGHVHQLDMGSSFDGENITAYITLNWNAIGSPRTLKRYRKGSVECSGGSYAEIGFGYSLGYGSDSISQPSTVTYPTPFSAAFWDSFNWDSFIWDGRTMYPTECEMLGTAENVQITLGSDSADFYSYAINSLIVHYSPRRGLR